MHSEQKSSGSRQQRLSPALLKKLFFYGSIVIVASFGLLSLLSHNGILDLLRLKALYRSAQEENSFLSRQQEELSSEAERLRDPRYLEYLARERLGYLRPKDIFIVLDAAVPQSPVDNGRSPALPESP